MQVADLTFSAKRRLAVPKSSALERNAICCSQPPCPTYPTFIAARWLLGSPVWGPKPMAGKLKRNFSPFVWLSQNEPRLRRITSQDAGSRRDVGPDCARACKGTAGEALFRRQFSHRIPKL